MKNKCRISDFKSQISDFRFQILAAALLLLLAGCTSSASRQTTELGRWQGPAAPAAVTTEDWTYGSAPGLLLRTDNYIIHSTIENRSLVMSVAQVMEGALAQYRLLAPDVPQTSEPMECYLFASREQWADYTRRFAGPEAAVYLQIVRGGYAIRDRYVAFYFGDRAMYSLAAHEGWHQYVSRHFKGRLPPFLEEGIACMFEHVTFDNNLPRWNLSINPNRAHALRKAIEGNYLWPLEELITMHAGQVVNSRGARIEAFYAQNWAFARFLWEAEDGRFRPAMRRLLSETAGGTVRDPTRSLQRAGSPWNPRGVRPMLEHYLEMSFEEIDSAYQTFIRQAAFEEFSAQWQMQ